MTCRALPIIMTLALEPLTSELLNQEMRIAIRDSDDNRGFNHSKGVVVPATGHSLPQLLIKDPKNYGPGKEQGNERTVNLIGRNTYS
ncbi:MAG: hypothetical protein HRU19_27935 [Pseudobacteriovorax sp.]|nr:hypothetical protein [Pseudobacteriovorax sp.]